MSFNLLALWGKEKKVGNRLCFSLLMRAYCSTTSVQNVLHSDHGYCLLGQRFCLVFFHLVGFYLVFVCLLACF